MRRNNALFAGVAALVVAGAVVGLGWLLLGDRDRTRRPDPRPMPAPVAKGRKPVPEPGKIARQTPEKKPAGPSVAPAAPAPPPADVCARVEDLLREYDALFFDPGGGVQEVDRIHSLRERSQRIDKLIERLASLGEAAVPCLMTAFRADARQSRIDRQTVIVRSLAKIPGKAALDGLGEALSLSEAWGVKMVVVAQLAENGGPDGLALLATRLNLETDFRIRAAILKFLGQKKSAEGIQAAQRLAQGDENPNVRIAAIRALGEAEDPGSAGVLEDRARSDADVAVRQNAIQVYGRIMKDQALALLEDLLWRDPNLRVKSVAILALQEMDTEGARRLLERYATDPSGNEDARGRATNALAIMDRQRQSGGGLTIGRKLEGFEPRIDEMKPLQPRNEGIVPPKR